MLKDDSVVSLNDSTVVDIPSFDDPSLEFCEVDDRPVAMLSNSFFDVFSDKTLRPSKLDLEDIWYKSRSISKEDALEYAEERDKLKASA